MRLQCINVKFIMKFGIGYVYIFVYEKSWTFAEVQRGFSLSQEFLCYFYS